MSKDSSIGLGGIILGLINGRVLALWVSILEEAMLFDILLELASNCRKILEITHSNNRIGYQVSDAKIFFLVHRYVSH